MRILKHFNIINCLLITVIIIFVFGFLLPRMNTNATFVVPPLIKKPAEKNQFEIPKIQPLSPQEYRSIADQNLFHPERIVPPEKRAEAALPKPEFVLYGTLITPDLKMAYLEDKKAPVTTPGRGERQSALKIGESLSGFKVMEILTDKVVLTRGDETIQVLLQEPGSPKKRESVTAPGPRTTAPITRPGTPSPAAASPPPSPLPGRTAPLAPGQRPVPTGRMKGFPVPGVKPAPPAPPNS